MVLFHAAASWSLSKFPVLSPQCRGFLLDGQRQSSKLSLIADRHDKSQVVRSIAAVRQRKDTTKLAVFFRFFRAFPATNSLQKWSSGLQLRSAFSKIQKTALVSNDLSTLPLKSKVEIFRRVHAPLVPLTSYAPVRRFFPSAISMRLLRLEPPKSKSKAGHSYS